MQNVITMIENTAGIIAALKMETLIFNMATKRFDGDDLTWVDGYDGGKWDDYKAGGGKWEDHKVGDGLYVAVVPYCGTEPDDKVRIYCTGNYCDKVTDRKSAGAALTLMALNHRLNTMHEQGHPKADAMIELFYSLRDAVLDDATLDHSAILSFID